MYPNVNIIAEEVDVCSQNLNVPTDWIVNELDSKILDLKCPTSYLNVTEEQVSFHKYLL